MDKDNVHIDSAFVDHSWQEMSSLLDQEMPVKKRKKRILWIWFLGVGLLSLIGLTYLTQESPPQLKSFPIQQNSKISNNKIAQNSNSQSSIIAKKVLKKQAPTKSSDDIRVISTAKNFTKARPTVETPTTVGIGASKKAIPKKELSNQKADVKQPLLNKDKFNTPRKSITVLTPISGIRLTTLSYEDHQKQTFKTPKKNSSKWRFGIYAGVLTPKVGSFRTGLYANLTLNKKWTVHFGVGYAKRISTPILNNDDKPSNLVADIMAEVDTSTAAGAASPIGSFNNDMEAIANSSITYSNFNYIEVPILLQYTIRQKFTLEVGGNFSYLYGYRYQHNGASFFTNRTPTVPSIDNTRTTDLSSANTATIPTMNLSLVGGVNYQINRKLTTYANYHFSNYYLTGTTISTNPEKRWQQIEVGIRYYFK